MRFCEKYAPENAFAMGFNLKLCLYIHIFYVFVTQKQTKWAWFIMETTLPI